MGRPFLTYNLYRFKEEELPEPPFFVLLDLINRVKRENSQERRAVRQRYATNRSSYEGKQRNNNH